MWYEELMKNQVKAEVKAGEQIKEDEVQVEAQVEGEKGEETEVVGKSIETELIREADQMATILKVKGMSCQHCVMSVTKALGQLDGIKNVQVDLAKGEVQFDNTKSIGSDPIKKAITDAGYEVVSA